MTTTPLDAASVSRVEAGHGGRPLLCLHGFTGAKEDFAPVIEALAVRRRVVALDLPGHGGAPGPDAPGLDGPGSDELGGYGLAALAGWVVRALDALDLPQVHLLGHSMGGLVAQRVAAIAPERLTGLVLSGSGPGAPRREVIDAAARIASAARDEGLDAAFEESRRIAVAAGIDVDPVEPRAPVEAGDAQSGRAARDAYVRARYRRLQVGAIVGGARALATADPTESFLRGLDVPVLVVHGEHDHVWPTPDQQRLAEQLGGAERVELAGAGHSPQVDAPEAFVATVVAFLDRADERRGVPARGGEGAVTH